MKLDEFFIADGVPWVRSGVKICKRSHLQPIAGLAVEIVTAHAMIAAIPDGEDSAGRQKYRLPTAEELTDRAYRLAECLYAKFEEKGQILELPMPAVSDAAKE